MAKKKFRLEFTGLEEYMERLDKLGGNLQDVTERALEATHAHVTPKVENAFSKHNVKYTHNTMKSLRKDKKISWSGSVAEISVGFEIAKGGLPSIFLMYGTPRISPDKKLYNAFYGSKTKKEIAAIQEGILTEEIKKYL